MLKRVFQYLLSTKSLQLKYQCQNPLVQLESTKQTIFTVYTDSDYAQDPLTRKSTMGFIQLINNTPIHWRTKVTPLVCQSSTEAELQGAVFAVNESVWIRDLLIKLGFLDHIVKPTLLIDNMGSMLRIVNGNFTAKSKHYAVRLEVLLERFKNQEFSIEHVASEDNSADILTKPVTAKVIRTIVQLIFVMGNNSNHGDVLDM